MPSSNHEHESSKSVNQNVTAGRDANVAAGSVTVTRNYMVVVGIALALGGIAFAAIAGWKVTSDNAQTESIQIDPTPEQN